MTKNKTLKKTLLAVGIVFMTGCFLLIPNIQSKAARYTIKSHGILYGVSRSAPDKKVVFYASDIQYLQDELDALFDEIPE